jgi:hypothetical protein
MPAMRSPVLLAAPLVVVAALLALLPACELSVYSGMGASAGVAPVDPPAPSPLQGWSIQGQAQGGYAAEVDGEVQREGHPTIRFHPTRETGGAYATFMTTLDATPFRGRRAHAVVFVRTQGVTGRGDAWLRIQGSDSPADGPGMATSITHLAANADFTRYELMVDVPVDAASVQLGVGLGGAGMLWMDGVTVEAR